MARNNGGFILIKINKDLSEITADDFDKKIFREIVEKNIKKPLILETINECWVFPFMSLIDGTYYTHVIDISYAPGGSFDGAYGITITYELETDSLTYTRYEI